LTTFVFWVAFAIAVAAEEVAGSCTAAEDRLLPTAVAFSSYKDKFSSLPQ